MGEELQLVVRHSRNHSGVRQTPIQTIVIHTYECPRGDDIVPRAEYQERSETSYNVLVGSHRALEAVPDQQAPWAAGRTANQRGLHLSFLAYAADPPARWLEHHNQLDLGARIVAAWCRRHNIPPVKITPSDLQAGTRGVCGHADTSAAWHETDHTDPGPNFPWGEFLQRVKQHLGGGPPTNTLETRMKPTEKVLSYSRQHIRQDTGYWCGPATVQTITWAATGTLLGEAQFAREMGTTTAGTNYIGLLTNCLNRHVPAARYATVTMPNDPPTTAQREALWQHLVRSIDAGYGVAANIVAPPSNYPRPSYTSTQRLGYGGGTVYHYVAFMGYAVDSRGGRHVWWADSGFAPYGCWITLEQTATLIPPKGYAYATAGGKHHAPTNPTPTPKKEATPVVESIVRDNQIQLRGPELKGWQVQALAEAMAARDGDAGTLVELLATVLMTVRDNQVQLRGPALEGWDIDTLAEAQKKRKDGAGTVPELLAVLVKEVRDLRDEVNHLKK